MNATPRKNGLRILNIHFQSLRKKGKLLEPVIVDSDPDIIFGTETWLDDSIKTSEILPNEFEYTIHRRDRSTDYHGGVLITAKNHLELHNIQKSKAIEMISGEIKLNTKKVTLSAYYRPPNRTDNHYLYNTVEEFISIKQRAKKNIMIVAGDFNLPDISSNIKTLNARLLARVITGCHYT
jgi:exonuclease III